jgi:hypothetical protein
MLPNRVVGPAEWMPGKGTNPATRVIKQNTGAPHA